MSEMSLGTCFVKGHNSFSLGEKQFQNDKASVTDSVEM